MRSVEGPSRTKNKTCKGRKILNRTTATIDPHCIIVSCKTKASGEPVQKPAVGKGKPLLYRFPRKKIMSQNHTETLINKNKVVCDSNPNPSFGRDSNVQQAAPGRHPASARKINTD
ncbi:hypothetical protein PoB_003146200 [Plakobranchus ocellatus]|uniref:Uncharacterized protein n=1 Tax=Plakobranchus ocellatus TaxID=259542 RepID=A0AAV4ACE4_9GAST|nr:hypothetical protein PoB_003146200 [Plakobranchus ocellatus]